jgi:hypothetical protein
VFETAISGNTHLFSGALLSRLCLEKPACGEWHGATRFNNPVIRGVWKVVLEKIF